jgi:hypothetical protein
VPSAIALSKLVVVKVGTEEKRYTLHKKLLTYQSNYFRPALSRSTSTTLHDINTEEFDTMIDWMYKKRLPSCIDTQNGWLTYHTYILAEKLSVGRLMDTLMSEIFQRLLDHVPTVKVVTYLFRELPADDLMLQLAVDAFCANNGVGTNGR